MVFAGFKFTSSSQPVMLTAIAASSNIDINILDFILEKWLPDEKLESVTDIEKIESDSPAFRIEGVDVDSGIYMTGGNARNYLKTLGIFRDDGLEKINTIRECAETNDLSLYAVHVHALKSASASIGAARVSNLARSLEIAAKNNDTEFIGKNNEKFIEELTMLLESIKIAVAAMRSTKKEPGGEVDIELVVNQAEKLRQALDVFDMEEVDSTLAILRTQAAGEMEKTIEEISNSILICEYDKANELIEYLVSLVEE